MLKAKIIAGFVVSMALFACSPAEMPSRGLNIASPTVPDISTVRDAVQAQYNVVGYSVSVPRSLLVSEADVYLPIADIVWHGDPDGDRYEQIKAIFDAALAQSTQDMTQGRAVTVSVEIKKFHALTPKTRATVGGNFAMHFYLTVLDAETNEVLDGPRMVVADTKASGGVRALREEQRGITQKSVILAHLIDVFDDELTRAARSGSCAAGHEPQRLLAFGSDFGRVAAFLTAKTAVKGGHDLPFIHSARA